MLVDAIDSWVRKGGVLLNEAHLGAYNDDIGRHSSVIPGFGLDTKWGIKEIETTSTYRMVLNDKQNLKLNVGPDVEKLIRDFGVSGGQFVPIAMKDSSVVWGSDRFAKIKATNANSLGSFADDYPTIISKNIGSGKIYYCGTNIGEGSQKDKTGFNKLLTKLLAESKVETILKSQTENILVRTLSLDNKVKFIVVRNLQGKDATVALHFEGKAKGLFSEISFKANQKIDLPKDFCDIFVVE